MDRTHITQQTSTAVSLRGELAHEAPAPRPLQRVAFRGPLQWWLEGLGWGVLRPALDFLAACVAIAVAFGGVRAALHARSAAAPLLALPPLVPLLFAVAGLYRSRMRALVLDGFVPGVGAVSVAAMVVALAGRLLTGALPPSSVWLHAFLYTLLASGLGRILLAGVQHWARIRRLVGKPVLIVGAGVVGAQVARRLESHPEYGLAPAGFLDEAPPSLAEVGGRDAPVVGTIEDLDEVVSRTGVRSLIVAFSSVADARMTRVIQRCQELGVDVLVVPRMFDTINDRVGYDTLGGLPLLSFAGVDPKGLEFAVKHVLDRVLALALLAAFSPILLVCALAVRLSSPGPVLFTQRRVGRDGKMFDLYKFRSMRVPEAGVEDGTREGEALDYLLAGDLAPGGVEGEDRRTAVGHVLRRSSLDELPQLINVLRGDMSLVGPRPERPEYVELFREELARYGDRHRVKSGITGWAQVHGLRGQTSLAERVEWDNYYISHWSLALDLKILALTLVALFRSAE